MAKNGNNLRLLLYFGIWIILIILTIILNILNTDWERTNYVTGILLIVLLMILQGTVLEIPIQTIFVLALGGHDRLPETTERHNLKLIINYNLLANFKDEIDECMKNMFDAYMGNLHQNVVAVLVSATQDRDLKQYELDVRDDIRKLIYTTLYLEGMAFCNQRYNEIDSTRLTHFWSAFKDYNMREFKTLHMHHICKDRMDNFMVLNRVTKVLRKCGQYQDLILLSEGEDKCYTYCDKKLYNSSARTFGEPLFEPTADVSRIFGKHFDYTLVLDGDTIVPKETAIKLMEVAAANPKRGIIQPGIILDYSKGDTLFMHLNAMRQHLNQPTNNALTALFDHSSFYGKGLVNNKRYADNVIGRRSKLIERVPIDVLSHDTFEASIMDTMFVGSIPLIEEAPLNYVTWGIRERRWNKGEILLAMYFWPRLFGRPMRYLQRKFQKGFKEPTVRTVSNLSFVGSYMANSALRQMFVKPILLLFLIIHMFGIFRSPYMSISVTMFLIIIFPKLATLNKHTYKLVILESIASILQFTPEAMTGTVRVFRAFQSIITNDTHWIPQRAVEEEFKNSNPFISAFHHLWGYSLFSVLSVIIVFLFIGNRYFYLFMAITVFGLPFFTAITSLPYHRTVTFKGAKKSTETVSLSETSNRTYYSTLVSNPVEEFSKKNKIMTFQTKPNSLSLQCLECCTLKISPQLLQNV